jgi:hypothetical protein
MKIAGQERGGERERKRGSDEYCVYCGGSGGEYIWRI